MLSFYRLPHPATNEKILKVVRKDIFILVKVFAAFLLFFTLPFIFFGTAYFLNISLFEGQLRYPLVVLGLSAYYLFIVLFTFFNFVDYYLDLWIITNERIIDIEQKGFFSRTISEQKILNVQDVTSETNGILATMLKFGNVHVQSAGAKQRFLFKDIPEPDRIRDLIIKQAEKNKINNETHSGLEFSNNDRKKNEVEENKIKW